MGSPIVTITKVAFSIARWMVEASGAVAEELLCEYRMVAMAVFLGKTFLGDGALLDCLLHHSVGKDKFIPPNEICFQKAGDPPTLERNTCWQIGSLIITITKVAFPEAHWMVEAPGAVAEEQLCEYRMVAMAVFLGKHSWGMEPSWIACCIIRLAKISLFHQMKSASRRQEIPQLWSAILVGR